MNEKTRVAFISLGCAKNLVDSEKMLGMLAEAGCAITNDPAQADAIVVNTCGFLSAARLEAHQAIQEAIAYKPNQPNLRVVVAGCLVQRDGARLLEDVPSIDALVGVNNRHDLVQAVTGRAADKPDLYLGDYYWRQDDDRARLRLTPRHYAYLRISEGCDQKCTFCTIPAIRGSMHCKSPDQIMDEARELVSDGAVELNLIGQDTTGYGRDIDEASGLAGLLRQLNTLDNVRWIRLLYAYPTSVTDELLDAMALGDKVVPYIDIPLQHISDRVLRAMNRGVTRAQTESLLEKIRSRIPGVSIRTTLITGFPGETDKEFEELCQFVRDFRFDALGVFPYSQEPDTPAGRMKDQLPDEVRQERADVLMQIQQGIAFELARARVGRLFSVLVDDYAEDGMRIARHTGQAPEVDSCVLLSSEHHQPGDILSVLCTGTQDYDLIAKPDGVILPDIE